MRALVVALLLCPAIAGAQKVLVAGTHEVPPFVIHDPDGGWSGISIDLWKRIAADLGYQTEIRDVAVKDLVSGQREDLDVVISLNITAERERLFDLTHAFYSTGLAIAVAPRANGVGAMLKRALSVQLLVVVLGILGLLVLAAVLMWRIEHRQNPEEFGGKGGFLAGIFWAVETVVGYGDPTHKTRGGRLLGILWALAGVVLLTTLTAKLASQLTVDELGSDIRGLDDLGRVEVGTVADSPAARFLARRGIRARAYPDARVLVDALSRREIGAAVYEAPILAHVARDAPGVRVLVGTFDNHGYGFGLRPGSPLREDVNRALLRITSSEEWPLILVKYLGQE